MVSKFTSILISFGFIFSLITAFNKRELSQEQAIKLAEQFIRDNGYTTFPADTSKLSYELFDSRYKMDTILKRRHNTLQSKAFCIAEDGERWDIGFLVADIKINELNSIQRQSDLPGRAVIVYKNWTEIRIAHKTPAFSKFKKL